jgi:hypothetical protein
MRPILLAVVAVLLEQRQHLAQRAIGLRRGDFLRVSRIIQIDTEVSDEQALVTAEVEMKVLSPFAVCSPIASSCTGTCWDLNSGQAKPVPRSRENLPIAHRLRIEKSFAFRKTDGGTWRCDTGALQPIELGVALSGP